MFKHFCFLCAAACGLWSILIAVFATACSSNVGKNEADGEKGVINLFLGKLQVPLFDSISVRISAADMESIHISVNSLKDNIKIDGVPHGENRKFEVKIYADHGKLIQKGEAVTDIIAEESITIPITLNALMGFLKLEVPLGISNSTGVSSGKLTLSYQGLEFNMKIENGKGVFETNSLPLDENIEITVKLYREDGTLLFHGSKDLKLSSILQTESMQLKSTTGSAILELVAGSEGPMQILAMLPEAAYKKRTPQNYGDLFFTEIYANPSEDDYFQYMELYNPTSDTLQLLSKHCKIMRTDNGTQHEITDLTIPPMSYAVIGRSKVLNKDYNCGSFALLKTEMSLGLFCGDSAIDTLIYSNKGDNKFPLEKGTAMQLPLENYENRILGASWCLGFSPKQDATCN
jgi:hypothetical protein